MAQRSSVQSDSRASDLETDSEVKFVVLRSLTPVNLSVAGSVTGQLYKFPQSGSEVKVALADVEGLLNKRRGGCCGARPEPYFELVK